MSNWIRTEISLGSVLERKAIKLEFIATENTPEIVDMEVSCNCVRIKSYDGAVLKVTYVPNRIPPQRASDGFYKSNKTITVTYRDGSREVLSIKATVKNKFLWRNKK